MKNDYDVVIVGAGHGGLGAGAVLAEQGYRVLILEQHNIPGGCSSSFVRGRFEFETGVHYLPYGEGDNKTPYNKFWGDRMGVSEKWGRVPDSFVLAYHNKEGKDVRYDVPTTLPEFIQYCAALDPEGVPALKTFFNACQETFGAMSYIKDPNMKTEVLEEKFPNFVKYNRMSLKEAYDDMGVPQTFRDLLDVCWFYPGIGDGRYPFTFGAILTFTMKVLPGYVPAHCSHGVTADMEKIIREKGGDIFFNTKVSRILVENGKVVGVETEKGDHFDCPLVISNASPDLVYRELVYPKSEVPEKAMKLCNSRTMGSSLFVVYMGLDATAEELGITEYHNFTAEHWDNDYMDEASYKLEVPLYQGAICYNKAYPEFTAPGTCIFVPTGLIRGDAFEGVKPEEYFEVKERLAEGMIKNIEKRLNINLHDHIEEIEIATPETFANIVNLYNGAVYSYEQWGTDSPDIRPMARKSEQYIQGLEFVGAFSPESAIGYKNGPSGGDIAERIISELKEVQ